MYKRLKIIAVLLFLVTILSTFIGSTIINHQSWMDIKDEFYHAKIQLMDYYINQAKDDMESLIFSNAVWTDLQLKIQEKDTSWIYENAAGYLVDNESLNIDYVLVTDEALSFMDENGDDIAETIMTSKTFNRALEQNLKSSEILWINDEPMLIVSSPIKNNTYGSPMGTYTLGRWLNSERLEDLKVILDNDSIRSLSLDHTNQYETLETENYSAIKFSHKIEMDNSIDYFNAELVTPVFHNAFVTKKNHAMLVVMGIALISVLFAFLYYKKMLGTITNVLDAVKRISEGEYDARANTTPMAELNQLAVAINKMAVDITGRLNEIDKNYLHMIEIMANALELNDAYTSEHNLRVADIAEMIGNHIGYEDIECLKVAARLHDIGKISIPSEILNKPGNLTEEEFEMIKTHSVAGYQIMDKIDFFKEIKYGVLYHHERYDGKGYPEGLLGDEIPLLAQIISIADVFDALITDRPYRKALPTEMAIEIMLENSGKMFNPELIDAFMIQYNKFIDDVKRSME